MVETLAFEVEKLPAASLLTEKHTMFFIGQNGGTGLKYDSGVIPGLYIAFTIKCTGEHQSLSSASQFGMLRWRRQYWKQRLCEMPRLASVALPVGSDRHRYVWLSDVQSIACSWGPLLAQFCLV